MPRQSRPSGPYLCLHLILKLVERSTPHSVREETEAQGTGCSSLKVIADYQTTDTRDSVETERKKLR